jgi:hypothetical protein
VKPLHAEPLTYTKKCGEKTITVVMVVMMVAMEGMAVW